MKHLKLTSHQPSSEIKERRALFLDYKQCYTCKMEFDGFWNLMNHRKSSHPTNKKCRNYPLNCQFKTECWYVHQDDKSEDKSELGVNDAKLMEKFKCNICEFEFDSKHSLMKHKKDSHIATVQRCEGYASGNCIRSENECWFNHVKEKSESQNKSRQQDFCKAQENPFPPDQFRKMMEMVTNLCQKVENVEQKLAKITNQ